MTWFSKPLFNRDCSDWMIGWGDRAIEIRFDVLPATELSYEKLSTMRFTDR